MISKFENTNEDVNKRERICSFYVSDYHFEMITLPYIENEIKQNHNIVILTENDLENTIKKVLNNVNFSEEDKNRIFALDWSENDLYKLDSITKSMTRNLKTTVFIKGGKNYVQKMNSYIQEMVNSKDVKSIDCYFIDDVQNQLKDIVRQYDSVLNTAGKINL